MPKDTTKLDNQLIEVDPSAVRRELDRIHDKAKASAESGSSLTKHRKTSAEQLGCHSGALKAIEQIDKKSDQALADFMRSFIPLYQAMYPQWVERMGDLVDKMEKDAADMEKDM